MSEPPGGPRPAGEAECARVLVAQIGARRHYAVPRALHRLGMLEGLVTDAHAEAHPWRVLDRAVPERLRPAALRRVLDRRIHDVPRDVVRDLPAFALAGLRGRSHGESQPDYWARRNADFCRRVVAAGFGAADAVYCFNGAALEIFHAARDRGLRTFLDQTAAPWRWNSRLLAEERERWPGWETEAAEVDVAGRLTEREEAEWDLADRIICGSEFAARALAETRGTSERSIVVPYPRPANPDGCVASAVPPLRHDGRLRVLFVGTLQLRKGIQYLYAAKKLLRGAPIDVRAVGPSRLSPRAMRQLQDEMEVIGPVPRHAVWEYYAWADVLVLPTLSEGSANVCHEAMAAGLPIITTPNAGAEIADGANSFVVPVGDVRSLAARIESLQTAFPIPRRAKQNGRESVGAQSDENLRRVIGLSADSRGASVFLASSA